MTLGEKSMIAKLVLSIAFSMLGLLCIAAALPESIVALCILASWILFAVALVTRR